MTQKQIQEQAEKYANSIVPNPNKHDAPYHTTLDRHNDITEAFEEGAKWMQEQGNWISVNDMLPEYGIPVLIYGNHCIKLATWNLTDIKYNYREWRDFNDCHCLPPTHWMPLPQKPKQD